MHRVTHFNLDTETWSGVCLCVSVFDPLTSLIGGSSHLWYYSGLVQGNQRRTERGLTHTVLRHSEKSSSALDRGQEMYRTWPIWSWTESGKKAQKAFREFWNTGLVQGLTQSPALKQWGREEHFFTCGAVWGSGYGREYREHTERGNTHSVCSKPRKMAMTCSGKLSTYWLQNREVGRM